jgi:hypothetical protein
MKKKSQGFICAATTEEYVRLAYGLALSAKLTYQQGMFSIVVTDKDHVKPEWRQAFDKVIEVDIPPDSNKFYLRSFFYELSPYDYTIAMDADMVFSRKMDGLFDLMKDGRPVVLSQAMTYRSTEITDRRFRKVFDEAKLVDAYSAMFMFDKSDTSKELFSLLKQMLGNWNVWRGLLPPKWSLLQPGTTDVSLGLALKTMNLKSAVTGWRPKFVHLKPELQDNDPIIQLDPKLCLGSSDYPFMSERSLIEIERIKQIYPVHYFNKEWLTEDRLSLLEKSYDAIR